MSSNCRFFAEGRSWEKVHRRFGPRDGSAIARPLLSALRILRCVTAEARSYPTHAHTAGNGSYPLFDLRNCLQSR